MSEERQKVLEMLAEGRLTPEQADRLLEALGSLGRGAPRPQPELRPSGADDRQGRFLSGLSADQLIKMRQHGVNPAFIQEMRDLGFTDLSVDQLVKLRIHGVNAEFLQGMRELGFEALPPDTLVKLRIHGVTPDFVREMRDLGFTDVDVDELIKLRIHGVNADYIREMRELAEQHAFLVNATVPIDADVAADEAAQEETPGEPAAPVWAGPVA